MSASTGSDEFHVLAVDDSSVDRKLIERLLRESPFRVTTVDSVKKALGLLGLEKDRKAYRKVPRVDMIITDYCMPDMTGYDLLKRVKECSALSDVPVVILSSENNPNRIRRCMEEGAAEFLFKPLRPSDVSRLCSQILQNSRC